MKIYCMIAFFCLLFAYGPINLNEVKRVTIEYNPNGTVSCKVNQNQIPVPKIVQPKPEPVYNNTTINHITIVSNPEIDFVSKHEKEKKVHNDTNVVDVRSFDDPHLFSIE
ncbi:hypothetical protein BDAP_001745 [Binucleata daphniae]